MLFCYTNLALTLLLQVTRAEYLLIRQLLSAQLDFWSGVRNAEMTGVNLGRQNVIAQTEMTSGIMPILF